MTPERWKKVEEVFNQVIDLPENERTNFLEKSCADDSELLHAIQSMLQHDTKQGPILQSIISKAADSLSNQESADFTNKRMGPYRITNLIGRGGMAEVYKAVRDDDQYQKQVAIKLIRRYSHSLLISRFWQERQILANLEHPCIARFLEGGQTSDGVPYLVMEYIDGVPITTYCDARNLNIEGRLKLFRLVCDAVQYAHRNLVIHRDLKPSNILVTAEGIPKLLDFGIAKLLNPDPEPANVAETITTLRVMTPEYASPEQVRGEPVTTAADVYSLGGVLYELLARERPHQFKTKSFAEIERIVCEQDPERPSVAVMRAQALETKKRQKISRELANELDNVILMAMQKDPQKRYQSVSQLTDDLDRYFSGLPVRARAQTLGYRASKFVRRHKTAVLLAAFTVIGLAGVTVIMTLEASRIAKERDRANQVTSLLVNVFEVSNPGEARGNTVTAREILDASQKRIQRDLKDQPELQAAMLDTIGRVYQNLGLYSTAVPLFEQSLKIRKEKLGGENVDVAATVNHLGDALFSAGKYEEAEGFSRTALAMRRKLLGNDDPAVADSLSSLGGGLSAMGKLDEAESVLREALQIREKALGPEHVAIATSLSQLGTLMSFKREFAEAEALHRRALNMRRKLLGNDHPDVASSLNNLGREVLEKGDYNQAETLLREAVSLDRKLLGPAHPDLAISMSNLARTLQSERKYPEAERIFRDVLALRKKALDPKHPSMGVAMCSLAIVLVDEGKLDEAESMFHDAQLIWKDSLPATHVNFSHVYSGLGRIQMAKGNLTDAEKLLREALRLITKSRSSSDPSVAKMECYLGECLTEERNYKEAEPILLEAYRAYSNHFGSKHPETIQSAKHLVSLYETWGNPVQLAHWKQLANEQ